MALNKSCPTRFSRLSCRRQAEKKRQVIRQTKFNKKHFGHTSRRYVWRRSRETISPFLARGVRYKPQYALGAIWRPLGTVVDTFHRLVYASLPQHIQCVFCVFFPSILDIKFVGRTSRGHTGGRSHRIYHPPSFCGACLNFSREKDSAIPFPRRP